jgi:hypothetical protein
VVGVIGKRDKQAQPIGEPDVYIFPFNELKAVSFASNSISKGGYGYFDMPGGRTTLEFGNLTKDTWWMDFGNMVKREVNRGKF